MPKLTPEKSVHQIRMKSGHLALEYVTYALNTSLRYDYTYIENQKTGCSTIKNTLIKAELGDASIELDFLMSHDRKFSPLLNPYQVGNLYSLLDKPEHCVFTFVRNPYTRVLSAYLDKVLNNLQVRSFLMKQVGLQSKLNEPPSFEQFIDIVTQQNIYLMDPHWRIQYHNILHKELEPDFVGRFESFDADFRTVLAKIGIDSSYFKTVNVHETKANSLMDKYYTSSIKEKVYKIYEIDFDTFNYSKHI